MIEAIVFDMDGVLVDSEPCWTRAEIEAYGEVGLRLTPELCARTTGLRIDAVTAYWYARRPWTGRSQAEVTAAIVARMETLLADAPPLPGVREVVELARRRGWRLGLCSSSPAVLIDRVVDALGLRGTLLMHSAEGEPYGKPHPAAYLTVARRLGVACERALVFEDSLNGAIAAKAAGMRVVAVPQGAAAASTRFDFCDARVASLREVDDALLDRLDAEAA